MSNPYLASWFDGGSDGSYVRHMLVRARSKRLRVVVFNSRGSADSPVTTPQMYSASFLRDLNEVVEHVATRSLIRAVFLVQYPCVILLIWSCQMRTYALALTEFTTDLSARL